MGALQWDDIEDFLPIYWDEEYMTMDQARSRFIRDSIMGT